MWTYPLRQWSLTWFVDHVVNPALTLLHPESPPLVFCHEVGGGHQFGQLLWKHDMSVERDIWFTKLIHHQSTENELYKQGG